jgi:hypothetical protein
MPSATIVAVAAMKARPPKKIRLSIGLGAPT